MVKKFRNRPILVVMNVLSSGQSQSDTNQRPARTGATQTGGSTMIAGIRKEIKITSTELA